MARFIDSQRAQYGIPVAIACRALGVSPSWFYKWRHGDASPRHARRQQLASEITRLFAEHKGRYGSPRIADDLHDEGWTVSVNTVASIMAEQQLVSRPRRRRRSTTRHGKGRWRAADLVGRKFAADRINQKWYGDGTEIETGEGKLQLDSVLDMGSRRIVGFAIGEHHDAELAYGALAMAVAVRGGKENITGVLLHSDQGSEFTAHTFRGACQRCGITQSMGRPGSGLDNAVIESWHSTLEFELRKLEHFDTKAQARAALVGFIEDYNTARKHSALKIDGRMHTPIGYEHILAAQTSNDAGVNGQAAPGRVRIVASSPASRPSPTGRPTAGPDTGSGRNDQAAIRKQTRRADQPRSA